MMDTKRIFHCALPVFLIVLFLLLRILPEVTGKPLFRSAVYIAAEDYLAENYAHFDFTIEDIVWSDHGGDYHAAIVSPADSDLRFTLVIDSHSKTVIQDSYAADVLSGKTKAQRLSREYGDLVAAALRSEGAPFPADNVVGLLDFTDSTLSAPLPDDPREVGKSAGYVYLSAECENADDSYIAHLVLTLKDYLDEQALPFYSLTLYLRGAYNTATRDITVENLLWESIYEEGMEERIAAHLSP